MFSVIIPLYNKENEIRKTIQSVLNQTYSCYEIIVIDDGSTDNSIQIVESISNDNIRLYKKYNGGESSARNMGITMAKYDYLCFLDADDYWEETYLERMHQLIVHNPGCGMYSSLYKYKQGSSLSIPRFPNFGEGNVSVRIDNYLKYSHKSPIITSSTAIIPKEILNIVGGFNEGLSHGPDLDLWLRIGLIYDIAIHLDYLAVYCLSANNRVCNTVPTFSKCIASKLGEYEKIVNTNYSKRYFNKIRLDFMSQYLRCKNIKDYKTIHHELQIFNIKSLIFKLIPVKLLIVLLKWYR